MLLGFLASLSLLFRGSMLSWSSIFFSFFFLSLKANKPGVSCCNPSPGNNSCLTHDSYTFLFLFFPSLLNSPPPFNPVSFHPQLSSFQYFNHWLIVTLILNHPALEGRQVPGVVTINPPLDGTGGPLPAIIDTPRPIAPLKDVYNPLAI